MIRILRIGIRKTACWRSEFHVPTLGIQPRCSLVRVKSCTHYCIPAGHWQMYPPHGSSQASTYLLYALSRCLWVEYSALCLSRDFYCGEWIATRCSGSETVIAFTWILTQNRISLSYNSNHLCIFLFYKIRCADCSIILGWPNSYFLSSTI